MMDALEFVRNYREMLEKRGFGLWITSDENTPEEIVAETEKWAADHPIKTRQSEFLKHYPGARILAHGCLNACPTDVFSFTEINCNAQPCFECKKAFWLAEVEDE
jgi:ferredoxin-like protein FixX